MTAYLLAALLAAVAVVPSLYRRWRDARTIARLRADAAVLAGRADTAEKQAAAVEVVAERRVEGERRESAVIAKADEVGGDHPERAAAYERVRLADAQRAAARVRAEIARRK